MANNVQLGPGNAQAIETAFAVFYKVGLTLSFFLQHNELLSSTSHLRTEVGQSFNDLLILVRDVSLYYRSRISVISSSEVTIDFITVFGKTLENFYKRKTHIIDLMWAFRLGEESGNVSLVRKWLGISNSTVREVMASRRESASHRDEYTCEWFQRSLFDFSRSKDATLVVTGTSGTGKTVLAGWIVERLQRPLGKKSFVSLSINIGMCL